MRRRKTLSLWKLDYTEGDLDYNTGRYRETLKHYKAALESRHVQSNDTLQMELLYRQISCHDWLHNESSKMRCVKLLMNLARKTGHRPMESIALFNMGKSLYYHRETKTETRLKPKNATSYSANSTTTSAATTILSGQYDEIFRISLPRERLLIEQQDTVNYYMSSVIKTLGYVCRDIGDYRKSSSYFERLAMLRDSLKHREQESAAQEYATLYESKEKDLQLQKKIISAKKT